MRIVLEPRCPKSVDGISFDPDPNWTFESLISELKAVEKKLPKPIIKTTSLNDFSKLPQPITDKTSSSLRSSGSFVMRASEYEMESDEEEKGDTQNCRKGKRFAYISDESDEPERMVNKMGVAETALCQMINDHQTQIKDDIRNQVRVLETEMMKETERYQSAIARIEKYGEARKELDRKLDLQYRQKVDEAIHTHLAEIRREHEMKMQIEERKIRSEEEAIRREWDRREKKIRQKPRRFTRKATKDSKTAEQKLAEEKAVVERLNGAGGKTIQTAENAVTLENQKKRRVV